MNITVLLITRMIVTMMLKVVLMIMIIIKNDIDKKKYSVYIFSTLFSIHSYSTDKENLFNNQERL